jgi:hypothetical protein
MQDDEVLCLLKQHPGLKTRTMTRMPGLPPKGLYKRVLARLIKRGLVRIEHGVGRYQGARYYAT